MLDIILVSLDWLLISPERNHKFFWLLVFGWTKALLLPQNSEIKPRGLYFSKALFEGIIFGGIYIRRDLSMEGNLRFTIDWASLIFGVTVFALF